MAASMFFSLDPSTFEVEEEEEEEEEVDENEVEESSGTIPEYLFDLMSFLTDRYTIVCRMHTTP